MNFDKNKFSFFSRAFRSLTIQVLLFIWAVILWRPIVRHWTTMKNDEGEQVYSSTLSIMKYSYDKLLKNSFSCFVVIGNTSFNLCGGSWQLEHGEKQEKVHWARQRQCEKGRLSRIIIFRTRIIFCLICLFTCEKWAASLDFVHLSWITSGFKASAEDENFFVRKQKFGKLEKFLCFDVECTRVYLTSVRDISRNFSRILKIYKTLNNSEIRKYISAEKMNSIRLSAFACAFNFISKFMQLLRDARKFTVFRSVLLPVENVIYSWKKFVVCSVYDRHFLSLGFPHLIFSWCEELTFKYLRFWWEVK